MQQRAGLREHNRLRRLPPNQLAPPPGRMTFSASTGFPDDSSAVEIGNGEVVAVVCAVRNSLGDALVRPGRVVVNLVLSQEGAQVVFPRGSACDPEAPGARLWVPIIHPCWSGRWTRSRHAQVAVATNGT